MNTPYTTSLPSAIFLDRDGTILHDRGAIKTPEEIELYPWTIDTLRKFHQQGFLLFIVSNQDKVATGELDITEVSVIHRHLHELFRYHGIPIQEWYVCPHGHQGDCCCRKPNPFFLEKAARDYSLNLATSFMIGDHPSDVQTAEKVGALGLYVLTGHGSRHLSQLPLNQLVFNHLGEAGNWILKHPSGWSSLEKVLDQAVTTLKEGNLVVFPTETVYGVGANVWNEKAVAKIFSVKNRPLEDPLIVHISNFEQLEELTTELPDIAKILMEKFWPGPLTFVLPKKTKVPDLVTAGLPSVAVRMPAHPIAKRLLEKSNFPIAAPSANRFMKTSPTTQNDAYMELGEEVPCYLDGGICRVGVESTVIRITDHQIQILRQGGVSQEVLQEIINDFPGWQLVSQPSKVTETERSLSPGLQMKHYAPTKPMVVTHEIDPWIHQKGIGIIFSLPPKQVPPECIYEVLQPNGLLEEAAINLYQSIRRLDQHPQVERIVAQYVDNKGLGRAVNERLRKASSGHTH